MQPKIERKPVVIVELRTPQQDRLAYATVATLTVYDDQTHTISGAADLFTTDVPVRDPARGRIVFADDPAGWARNLPSLHRTGYLTAVVTETP